MVLSYMPESSLNQEDQGLLVHKYMQVTECHKRLLINTSSTLSAWGRPMGRPSVCLCDGQMADSPPHIATRLVLKRSQTVRVLGARDIL